MSHNVPYAISLIAATMLLGAGLPGLAPAASSEQDTTLAARCPAAADWIASMHAKRATSHPAESRPMTDPALRQQLERRAAADQQWRDRVMQANAKPAPDDVHKLVNVDADNLAWLKSRVHAHGFPAVREVGTKGVRDAWLLVQHADANPAFQAHVLDLLKPRLATGDISRSDYALLEDRVRLAQGKKQIYGSQIDVRDGAYVLKPTVDETHLDSRRRSMNLMPIDDYLCAIKVTYGEP